MKPFTGVEMLCPCGFLFNLQVYGGTAHPCRMLTRRVEKLTANTLLAVTRHHIQLFEPARLAAVFEALGERQIRHAYCCVLFPSGYCLPFTLWVR
jgi:hypothetical protein